MWHPGILAFALALGTFAASGGVRAEAGSKRARKVPPAKPQPPPHPPQAEAPQRAADAGPPPAWVPPANEADLSLLRALLYVLEPAPREVRIIAVEDLALLGDPRALDALAHLVFDRDPEVAVSAVRAVTHFQHRRAHEILSNVIRHPTLTEELKQIAVEALPFQDGPRSRQMLIEIYTSTSWPARLRHAARNTLERMAAADGVPPR